LGVIIHHIEGFKKETGLPHYADLTRVIAPGAQGVSLFFVLSGFLMTHLFLEEARSQGDISIRRFYVRRCLRIWPLYYLIALIAFFAIPPLDTAGAHPPEPSPSRRHPLFHDNFPDHCPLRALLQIFRKPLLTPEGTLGRTGSVRPHP
ncbi:MAG: acyltransferase, partial [Deltaproteobacteria bacterium]|nr:acyltransferase [Deltaproteobacteria bacterium]